MNNFMTIQREDLHGYVVVHLHTNQKRLRKEKTKRVDINIRVPSKPSDQENEDV